MGKTVYTVSLILPENVSTIRMQHFINDAIETRCNKLASDDPLFGFDKCTVKLVKENVT